eukprot:12489325-Ditylum_brightwellii.AAC.1
MMNCYQHWAILVIKWPGQEAMFLLIKEVVTQGDPTSMIGYSVMLVPLADEVTKIKEACITLFYADNKCIDDSVWRNTKVIKFLVMKGPDQ